MNTSRSEITQRQTYHAALTTGRWTRPTLEQATKTLSDGAPIATLISALDLLCASTGISDALLTYLCESSAAQDVGMAHRCEAIALSRGHNDLAESARHRDTTQAQWTLARWPTLLARREHVPIWRRSLRDDARRLLMRTTSIDAWLATRRNTAAANTTVALVGNAPGALSGHKGAAINACDIVVRFNNGLPDESSREHIGQKTDLHVVSPGAFKSLLHSQSMTPDCAIALTASPGWTRPTRYWQTVARHSTGSVVSLLPHVWAELVGTLEAPPSAGLLMRQMMAAHPGVDTLVHGFDPQGLALGALNHHKDSALASSRHDFAREAALIAERF